MDVCKKFKEFFCFFHEHLTGLPQVLEVLETLGFFLSVIKHAINKSKMRPGRKIQHYHMKAMLYKIL